MFKNMVMNLYTIMEHKQDINMHTYKQYTMESRQETSSAKSSETNIIYKPQSEQSDST